MSLPPLPSIGTITERLPIIFPVGTPNRTYCIRDIASSTVFTMLYVNAVEGSGIQLAPKHVYRMTEEQSHKVETDERLAYHQCVLKNNCKVEGERWYEDTTREPIRDETLRDGLVQVGAALIDTSIPTTSGKGRYFLQKNFAELFNPDLGGEELESAVAKWQGENLSKSALARIAINATGGNTQNSIIVTFPNGETRHMNVGASSVISKHVVEVFARKYLIRPFVLWLSESGNKKPHRDDQLASRLGLTIDVKLDLPDIILVDTAPQDVLIVFVEVVATDGAITARRKQAIFNITDAAGFKRNQIAFVTAYMDRQSAGFKKTISDVDWNSFIWFASEPDNLFVLKEGVITLSELISKM
ncbi:BsuBI/PstI family type II restriction endonuclease [Pseudocnuella soli]|uniref:BsuBI/PstI family type II restriction endonuclease n=1 Tax=Pseudocnuella soli TaxID=2502779 RepID=UPI0010494259|nr:BsuBI/PstI family type II restriction endonuclease [Pseudocnuella soli]